MAFAWTTSTAPFTDAAGRQPARFVLEQVGDDAFRLVRPFRWRRRTGTVVEVTPASLGVTDLASIQPAVAWFVTRHGRHTPAALVHDQLTRTARSPEERAAADLAFREAMGELGVPPVRTAVMWATVAMATRWVGGPWRRAGILAWGACSLLGMGSLIQGAVRRRPTQVAVALVAPLPAAALWGRQWRAGIVAGYAVWFVLVPTATSLAGYSAYWSAEAALRAGRRLLARRGDPEPPGPVPFSETT